MAKLLTSRILIGGTHSGAGKQARHLLRSTATAKAVTYNSSCRSNLYFDKLEPHHVMGLVACDMVLDKLV